MLKSNLMKLLTLGLVMLLSACGSAEASQPAPVKEALPVEAAPLIQTQAENMPVETVIPDNEMVEKSAVEQEPESMVEKPALAGESAAKAEESAPVTKEAATMAKVEETAPNMKETEAMAAPVKKEETIQQSETMLKTGPTEAQAQLLASLDNQGMPPELFNKVWLNSDPLKLADLHGKVVIVEFWTFGCINCQHVVPALRAWHQKYQADGLVIIGVHTPEFGYEGQVENVKQALLDQDIPYAVAIDNDWQTWRAYNNRYWPAKYFIDKAGNLRYIHIGEGGDEQQEEIIQALLAEKVL